MTKGPPIRRRPGILRAVAALFSAWRLHRADRKPASPYYDPKQFWGRR